MDDLTSGYNIAEILTLHPRFLDMLGFTYEEASAYLGYVLKKYGTGQDSFLRNFLATDREQLRRLSFPSRCGAFVQFHDLDLFL